MWQSEALQLLASLLHNTTTSSKYLVFPTFTEPPADYKSHGLTTFEIGKTELN